MLSVFAHLFTPLLFSNSVLAKLTINTFTDMCRAVFSHTCAAGVVFHHTRIDMLQRVIYERTQCCFYIASETIITLFSFSINLDTNTDFEIANLTPGYRCCNKGAITEVPHQKV